MRSRSKPRPSSTRPRWVRVPRSICGSEGWRRSGRRTDGEALIDRGEHLIEAGEHDQLDKTFDAEARDRCGLGNLGHIDPGESGAYDRYGGGIGLSARVFTVANRIDHILGHAHGTRMLD